MRASAGLRTLRLVSLVLAAGLIAGLSATSVSRRFPSVSDTPHPTIPDSELTLPSEAGAGPDGGRVFSIAIVATQPATVFVSMWSGGVFKSSDSGANWMPADRGLPGYRDGRVCDLTADPTDRSVLYARCGHDLFKTTDRGGTWQQLDVDNAWRPVIAPSDSRIVYEEPNTTSIVRSSDGGRHWEEVATSGLTSQAESYLVDPRNRLVLYAGTYDGVFKSGDGGVTWAPLNLGLPTEEAVGALALDPLVENTAFAGTSLGCYKTTTGGKMWTRVGDGLPEGRFEGLAVRGAASELLYAQIDDRLFRSIDAGGHWLPIDESLRKDVPSGIALSQMFVVDPWSPFTLYVGTDAGVYLTTDGGTTWRPVNHGLSRLDVHDLVLREGNPFTLFVRGDASAFSTSDNGGTWRRLNDSESFPVRATIENEPRWQAIQLPDGRPPVGLTVFPRNPDVAYASTWNVIERHIWHTQNGGASWDQVDDCSRSIGAICRPIVDPNDANTAFLTIENVNSEGYEIKKTADGGRTWRQLELIAEAFVVLPTNPATVFAQIARELRKSTDRGEHWTASSEGLPDATISHIVAASTDAKHLFAGTKGRGVYESRDGGATWRPTAGH